MAYKRTPTVIDNDHLKTSIAGGLAQVNSLEFEFKIIWHFLFSCKPFVFKICSLSSLNACPSTSIQEYTNLNWSIFGKSIDTVSKSQQRSVYVGTLSEPCTTVCCDSRSFRASKINQRHLGYFDISAQA